MPVWITWLAVVAGLYPFWRAWQANRRTSLAHATLWATAAWLCWGLALSSPREPELFVALSLTGCAGIAVLGARRPHAMAWNFVVLGLLSVLTLPLLEKWLIGVESWTQMRLTFLAGTLILGAINYVPTRFALPTVVFSLAAGEWFVRMTGGTFLSMAPSAWESIGILAAPWFALGFARRIVGGGIDDEWLSFRDRYGLVWGEPVREQFNRSAEHAGLPVRLAWKGLLATEDMSADVRVEAQRIFHALTRRFLEP